MDGLSENFGNSIVIALKMGYPFDMLPHGMQQAWASRRDFLQRPKAKAKATSTSGHQGSCPGSTEAIPDYQEPI